jgi:hypothetical protein
LFTISSKSISYRGQSLVALAALLGDLLMAATCLRPQKIYAGDLLLQSHRTTQELRITVKYEIEEPDSNATDSH